MTPSDKSDEKEKIYPNHNGKKNKESHDDLVQQ